MDLFDFARSDEKPTEAAKPSVDAEAVELKALQDSLAHHQELYHDGDAPEISDEEYDGQRLRALQILKARPDLATEDMPVDRVGATPKGRLPKIAHEIPMLSLDNAFTRQDVVDFDAGVCRYLGLEPGSVTYTAEPKDDGLSASLIYENGTLQRVVTRGDKTIGEVVTAQALTARGVPSRLNAPYPERIEVRGEIYMSHADFADINRRFASEGKAPLKNCRNGAAGALRQSDPAETARRPLRFWAYEIAQTTGDLARTQKDVVEELEAYGFEVNPLFAECADVDALIVHQELIGSRRAGLGYDIDGVVYKVSDRALQKRLGTVSRVPRYAIAHKFAAERVSTRLTSIDIQVGRTGKQTPVGRLSPVNVGGVVVTNATLHNEDEIRIKDLRVGDLVVVQRAGDVIPQIVGLADMPGEDRSTREPYSFPQECAACGSHAIREPGEADRRCVAGLACDAQRKERLEHLASKRALDIDGLGSKDIAQLVDAGLIAEPADIFRLKDRIVDLVSLEGWGQTSARKKLAAIEASRSSPLDRVLYAFGIRHVGETASTLFARRYGSMDALRSAMIPLQEMRRSERERATATGDWGSNRNGAFDEARFEEELAKRISETLAIPQIGPEIISSLLDFLDEPHNVSMLDDVCEQMDVQDVVFETTESEVTGKTVVFTGSLEHMGRKEAEAHAETLGARTSGSVSAKTDILVYGPGAGSKLTKAQGLGVRCLTEEEWRALVGL
jgi:DNA ligase (NAD+)